MDKKHKKQRIGNYVRSSASDTVSYLAYIPSPLPPDPPLDMADLAPLLERAHIAIGRLDSMIDPLSDFSSALRTYFIRKEAVSSSQIEGTQSTLSDVLVYEAGDKKLNTPIEDAIETLRYVYAMEYGLKRIKDIPISLRLIREVHKKLMTDTRGQNKQPGEFRKSQNWIGGSKPSNADFVPPPPNHVMDGLDNLEKFLNDERTDLPVLVKAAITHVQFEIIHPFLDGNGRLGRLLIIFILCAEDILKQPVLGLSSYLKTNHKGYYNHLQSVQEKGDWEAWIEFFLTGVIETAEQAIETMQAIRTLFAADNDKISKRGRSAASVFKIHAHLEKYPMTTTRKIKEDTGLSLPTVLRGLETLKTLDIVKEPEVKSRNRVFIYKKYLSLLNEGTEPLPR